MANIVGEFEKVSLEEYTRALKEVFPKHEWEETEIEEIYNRIILPIRSTKLSAGYDFFLPFHFTLYPGCAIMIPTGIRCKINDDWALFLYPKSGIGCKTSIRFSNTIPLIDADYYNSSNEGHIMVKLEMPVSSPDGYFYVSRTRFGNALTMEKKAYTFEERCKFIQGVFLPYGVTESDDLVDKPDRDGGFGSTGDGTEDNPTPENPDNPPEIEEDVKPTPGEPVEEEPSDTSESGSSNTEDDSVDDILKDLEESSEDLEEEPSDSEQIENSDIDDMLS